MDPIVIILIALFVISAAAMFLFLPRSIFESVFARTLPLRLGDPEETKGTMWEPFSDTIRENTERIRQLAWEKAEITSFDGLKLVGHICRAENEKAFVLLAHGYHSYCFQDFSCSACAMLEKGYSILMIEQRAHGESEGDYSTFGVKERRDIQSWCSFLVSRFGDKIPLFLEGISMGATTVMMAAALPLDGNIRGIIADCGFTSPKDEFLFQLKEKYHAPAFPILPLVDREAKKRAGFSFEECSTLETLKISPYPLLIIHGKEDQTVPYTMSEENYAACTAPKKLILVEKAGHGVSYLVDRKTCSDALFTFLELNT